MKQAGKNKPPIVWYVTNASYAENHRVCADLPTGRQGATELCTRRSPVFLCGLL
jgi:hypothetical protein